MVGVMTCQMSLSLLLLALTTTFAAPADYDTEQVFVPQKRAALVLDRLLVALSKALREEQAWGDAGDEGPRTAPLRIPSIDTNDMSALQRRGQAGATGRGRVLRCYFNAITCF